MQAPSAIPPALISSARLDKKGRIVLDSKIREKAAMKAGDEFRLALMMSPQGDWFLGVSKA